VNGTEEEGLRRAVERLMEGQREALEVIRQALDGEAPAEDSLGDLEDILEGARTRGTKLDPPAGILICPGPHGPH
jgi:hypothetical protein